MSANSKNDFERIQAYVGLPYVQDKMDCADLFLKVQREVFEHQHHIPCDLKMHARDGAAQRRQIRRAILACGNRLERAQHGCMVLFKPAERGVWHMGTVVEYGEVWILHASRISGSAELTRLRDMLLRGYVVEGYYTWKR